MQVKIEKNIKKEFFPQCFEVTSAKLHTLEYKLKALPFGDILISLYTECAVNSLLLNHSTVAWVNVQVAIEKNGPWRTINKETQICHTKITRIPMGTLPMKYIKLKAVRGSLWGILKDNIKLLGVFEEDAGAFFDESDYELLFSGPKYIMYKGEKAKKHFN